MDACPEIPAGLDFNVTNEMDDLPNENIREVAYTMALLMSIREIKKPLDIKGS